MKKEIADNGQPSLTFYVWKNVQIFWYESMKRVEAFL